jgi:cytochrome P450
VGAQALGTMPDMTERRPVSDWATDFDHLSPEWAAHSPEILADLRERCPVAHTERFHGAYLVTRYDDITEVARQPEAFSSRVTAVNDNHPDNIRLELPPITLDPPEHGPVRRALLPAFNPREVDALEPFVRDMVARLLDDIAGREHVDGALDYAQLVPVEVMSHLFGVPTELGPQFRAWVDAFLKEGQVELDIARKANREVQAFFAAQLQERRERPADDLVTMLLDAHAQNDDGSTRPFTERERIGGLFVLMLGGIDTTWSSLGAALYHLGSHPEDLATLVERPELIPGAIEEFLRFYTPVTIARVITEDAEIAGTPVKGGERLLLSYPSANRDPAHFEGPDEVVLDRQRNRHVAFGVGVHRCLGSNLARMELRVALEAWLARYPRFELAVDPAEITWSVGPVRGPRKVPLRILA